MGSVKEHYSVFFNQEGDLKIIDYALEATNSSLPFVALRTRESVVVATKRELYEVLEIPTNRSIVKLNNKCWMAVTGRTADVDQIIILARNIANDAISDLGFEPTADILARLLADHNHKYIMRTGVRAISFSCVIFGFDQTTELWQTDSSAVLYPYYGIAVGQNNLKMNKFLEKHYDEDMTDEKALMCAVRALGESIGSDFSPDAIDVAILKRDEKLKMLNVSEIDMVLQKISEID
ncbi:20S proteasome, regulatory subunit alpha type PSMA6/SCL1 [Pseudoloma neurophilia]|uniref:20S proteasome, regulatory subunit alpha type PSMA6/SCL1 n=1 Tax=Pseudoloma neurophilia TaxID=146866 RepID=A0A0R0M6Y3_9MICR|nr:20S proteasome, regulatory subunit alpha type PSMA6/SCL1 [Pseudoloma neurophilia]